MKFHSLRLEDLSLHVHLGCTPEERAFRQEVRVTIEIRFAEMPAAVENDRLTDTVCYAEISQSVQAACEEREYHLIERMAGEIYQIARKIIGSEAHAALAVQVHKVRPPVPSLRGGSFYRLGDFAP